MKWFWLFLFLSMQVNAQFDWQGHRGARGLYPENTINGMKEALKYPIQTLELDVVISRDHQVVVSHEPWMSDEICKDPKGTVVKGHEVNLYKLNYAEIEKFDCGSKPHPRFPLQKNVPEFKPLLKDLLKNLSSSGKNFNIEIKSTEDDEKLGFQPEYKVFSDAVVKVILDNLTTDKFTLQSFDWRVLKYVHEKYPQVKLVALREEAYKPQDVLSELGFSPFIFSPDYQLLTAADVAWFHEKNIRVIPWTVNNIEAMKKMIAMNVDGIITDYPNLILEIPKDLYLHPQCKKGFNYFEGKCIKIPSFAVASERNPGWVCKSGHVQKRNRCVKMNLPENAVLTDDGKSWTCLEGYTRYRNKCEK